MHLNWYERNGLVEDTSPGPKKGHKAVLAIGIFFFIILMAPMVFG